MNNLDQLFNDIKAEMHNPVLDESDNSGYTIYEKISDCVFHNILLDVVLIKAGNGVGVVLCNPGTYRLVMYLGAVAPNDDNSGVYAFIATHLVPFPTLFNDLSSAIRYLLGVYGVEIIV